MKPLLKTIEFRYELYGKEYILQYEGSKKPYLVNIFVDEDYVLTYHVNHVANKSNAERLIIIFLQEN